MKDQRSHRKSYRICVMILSWAILLVLIGEESEAVSQSVDSDSDDIDDATVSDHAGFPVADRPGPAADTGIAHKPASPEEKQRIFYLSTGKRMFRSRELKKAREAFGKVLELDAQNAQAHYFLGLIEYEEGNIEKAKTRFQIAHECLKPYSVSSMTIPTPDAKQIQLEVSNDYEARVYYKDGWYRRPKYSSSIDKTVHSLEAGSSYRIELKPRYKESWARSGIIGLILVASFFMAR